MRSEYVSPVYGDVPMPAPQRKLGRDFARLAHDLLPLWDCLAIVLAGYLANVVYGYWFAAPGFNSDFRAAYGHEALVGALLAPFMLRDQQLAAGAGRVCFDTVTRRLLLRFAGYCGVLLAMGFASRSLDYLPRAWVALWGGAGFVLTLMSRLLLFRHLQLLERHGILRESIAVVGAGPVADRLIRHLHRVKPNGVEIIGIFDDRSRRYPSTMHVPSGPIDDLIELGKLRAIDWILVTFPSTAEHRLLSVTHQLKTLSVPIAMCPQQVGLNLPYHMLDLVGDDLPVTLLADRPLSRWNAVIKSAEDFILGGLLTLLLLPVLGLIAVAIKIDSPGPVIYRQRRLGWNNREFEIYKFRSMRWNPAEPAAALQQTSRNDSRITALGVFLRRSSLDELPQLFNVLSGEMSLVGPRPHAVHMRTEQQLGHEVIEVYAHRHRVKPGITGWAQVNGFRGATDTTEQLRRRVEHDIHYIENCSLWFDLRILVMTFFCIIKGSNAY